MLSHNLSCCLLAIACRIVSPKCCLSPRPNAHRSHASSQAAMEECMARLGGGPPTPSHLALYKTWAKGGYGLIITGNVTVAQDHLGTPVGSCSSLPCSANEATVSLTSVLDQPRMTPIEWPGETTQRRAPPTATSPSFSSSMLAVRAFEAPEDHRSDQHSLPAPFSSRRATRSSLEPYLASSSLDRKP